MRKEKDWAVHLDGHGEREAKKRMAPFARILEKQNRLQMSQVFRFLCIDDQMGPAFQGFYKRDRRTGKVTEFPHQLYMHAHMKKTNEIRCVRGIPRFLPLTNFAPA